MCLASLSQAEYSGSVLKFAQWVRPFPSQLSLSTRPQVKSWVGGGTLDPPYSERGNNFRWKSVGFSEKSAILQFELLNTFPGTTEVHRIFVNCYYFFFNY